jgi:hypothetical protein
MAVTSMKNTGENPLFFYIYIKSITDKSLRLSSNPMEVEDPLVLNRPNSKPPAEKKDPFDPSPSSSPSPSLMQPPKQIRASQDDLLNFEPIE